MCEVLHAIHLVDPTIEVDPDLTQVGEDVGSIRGCIIGGSYSVQVEVRTVDFCDFEEEEVACGINSLTDYTVDSCVQYMYMNLLQMAQTILAWILQSHSTPGREDALP